MRVSEIRVKQIRVNQGLVFSFMYLVLVDAMDRSLLSIKNLHNRS